MKHTPGPWPLDYWTVRRDPSHFGSASNVTSNFEKLSASVGGNTGLREQEANARLIAAAPDMFEALANLENDDGKAMPPSAWKLVQDALAKARGES